MRRRLNLRFLACLLVPAVLLSVGAHFLHGFQVARNAGALKDKAQHARQEADHDVAAKEFERYLQLRPEDADARADYGLTLAELAEKNPDRRELRAGLDKAYSALEHAVREKPDRDDARNRLADVCLRTGRLSDAQAHLNELLRRTPHDADLEYRLGLCLLAEARYEDAAAQFQQAIKDNPRKLDSYTRLVDLWRDPKRLHRPEETDALVDQMIEANPDAAGAYVIRSRFYRSGGSGRDPNRAFLTLALQGADVFACFAGAGPGGIRAALAARSGGGPDLLLRAELDTGKARALAPDSAEVLQESAEVARARGQFDRAAAYAQRNLAAHPKDAQAYRQQAELAAQSGRRGDAVAVLREGVRATEDAELVLMLVDLLIADKDLKENLKEVDGYIDLLKQKNVDPALRALLEGRRKIALEEWSEASKVLERARLGLMNRERFERLDRQCDLLLGRCYEQLGDADRQYSAYLRVRDKNRGDGEWLVAAEGVARALLALNRLNEALEAYEKLIPWLPSARPAVARLTIARNLGLPQERRDWAKVDRLLADAQEAAPKSAEVAAVRVQALMARGQFAGARAALDQAREQDPKNVQLWVVQAGLEAAEKKPAEATAAALTVLDRAEGELGDQVELRLARIPHLLRAEDKPEAVKQKLAALGLNVDHLSPAERARLWRALGDAYQSLGDLPRSREVWEKLARQRPDDLSVRVKLFDLALQAPKDEPGLAPRVEGLLDDIRAREGEKGILWSFCNALWTIKNATAEDRHKLEEARLELKKVAGRREGWARVPVALAQIDRLLGDTDAAVAHYLSAIDMGERNPAVLLEAIRLLRERQRYQEAYNVIARLPEQAPLLQQLNHVVIDTALRTNNTNRAVELAEKAVKENPNDYQNHLSLAQVYWALADVKDDKLRNEHLKKSEEALLKAVAAADTNPQTWTTLILFLARTGRRDDAEKKIAEARGKLPAAKSRLALAQCYEAVGDVAAAEKLYREAVTDAPADLAARRAAAVFFVRAGNSRDAKENLEAIIKQKQQAPEEAARARRLYAIVLFAEPIDYVEKRKLLTELGFLDSAPGGAAETPEDRRTRAFLLAGQGRRRDREEAIRILERIRDVQPLAAGDKFMLAQLYESLGNTDKIQELMNAVLAEDPENAQYLAYFVRALLAWGAADEAGKYLERLEATQPKAWRTVELKARVLHARGKNEQALKALTGFAEEKDAPLPAVARLLEVIGEKKAAEQVYRKVVEGSKRPEARLLLAGFLGRRGETGDVAKALDVCDLVRPGGSTTDPAKWSPPELVGSVALEILYTAHASDQDKQRVEGWLNAALAAKDAPAPRRAALQQEMATLYILQNRPQDAEKMYRRTLAENPRDALAMNNLAWLLAAQGRGTGDALTLIQNAIDVRGPLSDFLDTRALVYLARGDAAKAVDEIKEVVDDKPTALGFFHLALAYQAGKNGDAARASFQKAKERGLSKKDLHVLERPKYDKLAAELAVP